MKSALFAAALILLMGCRKTEAPAESGKTEPTPDSPTPVKVAPVTQRSLDDVVSGPGHTAAQSQQKVRAPFAGTLLDLRVSDGDVVARGQAIGAIVSRESEAALSGAREMLREAHSPVERQDAERAVSLAEQNLVRKPILATADGPILSHAAASGDRLAEDQEILTIADASTIVFLADLPQNDLPRVRPGQRAAVDLGGGRRALSGFVHSVLPGANTADFTGPVRIDLPRTGQLLALGLFGIARITIAHRDDARVVPDTAVLRDDVSGTSRVASVVNGRVHWSFVTPGLRQGGVTEILGAPLLPGTSVIVAGMVGLPEGKTVSVQP